MEIPSAPLKGVFFLHFILTVWAMQASLLPLSYFFYNLFFLIVLLWAIHARDSEEPVFMGLVIDGVSILLDIITIVVWFPREANDYSENFSIGIAILNLILRPVTCVILHRVRSERVGSYNDYGIPGLGDYFGRRGPYENIDQPVPQSIPQTTADLDSPRHQNFGQDKNTVP